MFGGKLEVQNAELRAKLEYYEKECQKHETKIAALETRLHDAYMALVSKNAPMAYEDQNIKPVLIEKPNRNVDLMRQFAEENQQEQLITSKQDLEDLLGKFLAGTPPTPLHDGQES